MLLVDLDIGAKVSFNWGNRVPRMGDHITITYKHCPSRGWISGYSGENALTTTLPGQPESSMETVWA